MRQLTVFLLMLTLSVAASAKLYKWLDADGSVTYSERKPPDSKVKEVKLRGVTAVSAEQARSRLDGLKGAAEETKKDREFKQTASSETMERENRIAENCKTYRENLRVLKSAPRIKDNDGNFLDDSGRQARLAKTQAEISATCK
ncbi:MAG: hypothetical protein ACI9DC_000997 [Gammaproteobacteria bacterium]|jgi:hypothetical protein